MNRHNPLRWMSVLTLLTLILSACNPSQITPTPKPTDTPLPTPAPTLEHTPTSIATPSSGYEGWLEYTNTEHGFSFLYPPDWTLEEDQRVPSTSYKHLIWLKPQKEPNVVLSVGFKRFSEDIGIQRTGVGSGDLIVRGTLNFLGEPVVREVLVFQGKDMTVLYHSGGETRRRDLVFALSLDYVGSATDKSALQQDVEATADRIVESFELVK
jgi:hypothetical protein